MKMTENQLEIVRTTLGADPIPEDNPAMDQLKEAFGDHSFYLSENGLLVFEPEDETDDDNNTARLTMVAAWADEQKNSLAAVEPQPTDITVDLGDAGNAPGDA